MSKIEDQLAAKLLKTRLPHVIPLSNQLQERAEVGLKKYGVSLEDETQPLEIWLEHAIQEGLDLINYLEKIISISEGSDSNEINKIQKQTIQILTDLKHIKTFLNVK